MDKDSNAGCRFHNTKSRYLKALKSMLICNWITQFRYRITRFTDASNDLEQVVTMKKKWATDEQYHKW